MVEHSKSKSTQPTAKPPAPPCNAFRTVTLVLSLPCIYILGKDRQESEKQGTDEEEDDEDDEDESEGPKEEKESKKGLLSDSEEDEGEKDPKAAKSAFEERQSR